MKVRTMLGGAILLRPFQADDANDVNALFKLAYGDAYPYKVAGGLQEGTYCYVAVDQATERVIGFARTRWLDAMNMHATYPLVHELGGYVVAPSHRRHGIGNTLSLLCEGAANADRGDMHIAFSEPVCWGNELASQRIFEHHGFGVWGLSALKYPEISPDHHGAQPASMVIVARRSVSSGHADARFTAHRRYLPPDYEALVCELLGADPPQNGAVLGTHSFPGPMIHEPVATHNDVGAEIVDVPANWPEATAIIASLREEGYRFSAFLPEHGAVRGTDGALHRFDWIRLYRPPPRYRRHCNWDLVGVHTPMARRVKDFLIAEEAASQHL
jgi:hypothetical protein